MKPNPELIKVYKEEYQKTLLDHKKEIEAFDKQFRRSRLFDDVPEDGFIANRSKYFFDDIRPNHVISCIQTTLGEESGTGFKLIDLGAGTGDYIKIFQHLGYDCEGFLGGSFFYEDFKYAHNLLGLRMKYGDLLKKLPYQNESFDYVFSCMTLSLPSLFYHYKKIIEELRRIVTEKGEIIIVTHQTREKEEFERINDKLNDRRIKVWSWSEVKWRLTEV